MAKRNTSIAAPAIDNKYTTVDEWNGFAKGDLVHVSGTHGAEFRFQYAYERDGVVTEVTVVGGVNGHNKFRTFLPSRVTQPNKAKRRSVRADAI
jgi:hypothetical protein